MRPVSDCSEDKESVNEEDKQLWREELSIFTFPEFSDPSGVLINLGNDNKADKLFSLESKLFSLALWKPISMPDNNLQTSQSNCLLERHNGSRNEYFACSCQLLVYWSYFQKSRNLICDEKVPISRNITVPALQRFKQSTTMGLGEHQPWPTLQRPVSKNVLQNVQRCYLAKKKTLLLIKFLSSNTFMLSLSKDQKPPLLAE